MALKQGWKYNGTVGPNSSLITTQRGSLGYQVNLVCDDGETSFVIWLTEKNRKRAAGYFDVLGIPADKLKSKSYFEFQMALDIWGREVSFGTQVEEYNGKQQTKVSWIGKKSTESPAAEAAAFFAGDGGSSSAGASAPAVPAVKDEDIPF
jgi:hypothetical protein